jgi:hypothetical protein
VKTITVNRLVINSDKLHEELLAALPVVYKAISHNQDTGDLRVHLEDSATGADETTAANTVIAHDETQLTQDQQNEIDLVANEDDVNTRFDASLLKNKNPAQIYAAMQGQIDGWVSLADAQADLREWLPLMASLITTWKAQRG